MSNQALNDAVLVSRYLSSQGEDNTALATAIAKAESKLKGEQLTPTDEQELNKELGAAARRIKPKKTIEALRQEYDPPPSHFGWLMEKAPLFAIPFLVYAGCILLIFIIIPLTAHYNRIGVFISELKTAETADFFSLVNDARVTQQKLEAARKSPSTTSTDPASKAKAPPPPPKPAPVDQAQIDKLEPELKQKLKAVQEADSRISVNVESLRRVMDSHTGAPRWTGLIVESYGLDTVFRAIYRLLPSSQTNEPDEAPVTSPASASSPQAENAPCKLSKEFCLDIAHARGLGLYITDPDYVRKASAVRRQAESLSLLLGGSILPVFYGLLGASVFLLRSFLRAYKDKTLANQLDVSAFLRLGLGGIAGLAIGWFWVPTGKGPNDLVLPATNAPFALAFLAGFSIELLFSLLDRVLAAVNPSTSEQQPLSDGAGKVPVSRDTPPVGEQLQPGQTATVITEGKITKTIT